MNADGLVSTGQGMLSHNMFAYCANNPVVFKDPLGLAHCMSNEYGGGGGFGAAAIGGSGVLADTVKGAWYGTVGTIGAIWNIITFSNSGTQNNSSNNKSENNSSNNKSKPEKQGRAKNKLKPDIKAEGPHSTFKQNPNTGEITNYKTWQPNLNNPTGFELEKGYDGIGKSHKNSITGEDLMPHVHDKIVPGGVRRPLP
ncbi:hypothetical protein GCM10008908_28770 [Clostridium subterminale]|uniref:Bacterial toxin 24 domain-containing protein n=1 Tax=Clostridium subterminale TaxID=1550 RepID=A0ABN1KU72_CLOSU